MEEKNYSYGKRSRVSFSEVKNYSELYEFLEKGHFLQEDISKNFNRDIKAATADSF